MSNRYHLPIVQKQPGKFGGEIFSPQWENISPRMEKISGEEEKISPENTGIKKQVFKKTTNASGLYFEDLPAELQDKAKQLVAELPAELQADVVDELLGQIQGGIVRYPERMLKTLVKAAQAQDGSLSLGYARRHREHRRAREAAALARAAATQPPKQDEDAQIKGASLLHRLAPSIASRLNDAE
ncbi:MAG: hypothetical protein ACYC2R_09190 [Burkholderiales bacterium]